MSAQAQEIQKVAEMLWWEFFFFVIYSPNVYPYDMPDCEDRAAIKTVNNPCPHEVYILVGRER